jgi:uncharacterized protein (DUF924 family)
MYQAVLDFWFEEITQSQWWVKDEHFDQMIIDRFSALHKSAMAGELFEWRKTPQGRLAEIIVLDQFSRNMFRETPESFASDPLALALAQEAVSLKVDASLTAVQRSFLYMPYMHSESLLIHNEAVNLYQSNGIESNNEFEIKHKNIIQTFGRYPHRNNILNRVSTAEELAFLQQPGSGF